MTMVTWLLPIYIYILRTILDKAKRYFVTKCHNYYITFQDTNANKIIMKVL